MLGTSGRSQAYRDLLLGHGFASAELCAGQALADKVIAWLRERGFHLNGVYNMVCGRAGKAVQADFLFESRAADGRLSR